MSAPLKLDLAMQKVLHNHDEDDDPSTHCLDLLSLAICSHGKIRRGRERNAVQEKGVPEAGQEFNYISAAGLSLATTSEGSTASQRAESYHSVIREINNSQLSFEKSNHRFLQENVF
jgi:hypothetical protein